MPAGLLHPACLAECEHLLPPPSGLNFSYLGFLLVILLVFACGCCCGAGLLAGLGTAVWCWWQDSPSSADRLAGYRKAC